MKSFRRHIIALGLVVIYLAITVSPLASLAVRSKSVLHAMTGECVGDCDICGCSPERRASKTCCCSLKKRLHRETAGHPDECPAPSGATARNDAGSGTRDCCGKNGTAGKITVLSCNCPCGPGKSVGPWGAGKLELVFCRFAESPVPPSEYITYHITPQYPVSRHPEPPVPPPEAPSHA